MKVKIIEKGINFVKRQQKPFKINMVKASGQSFLKKLTTQYQSLYILSLGATPLELGLVNSIGGIASTIISTPIGHLADRQGIRKLFLIGIPLMILGSFLFAITPFWTATILATLIVLLGTQILTTGCPMVCGSYLKTNERVTGKQLCDTLVALPSLIAPTIAAIVIANFGGLTSQGIRPLYILQTIGFLLIFMWVYRFYFDTLKKPVLNTPSRFLHDFKEVFKKGTAVKSWIIYTFLHGTTHYIFFTYLPIFVMQVKHGNEFVIGSMATVSMILPFTLAVFVGRLADSYGRKKVLYATIPLYGLSLIFLIYAQNITMLLISGILQGFLMLTAVTHGAITAELVPVSMLGRWYGIRNLSAGLASIIGPVIAGLIWERIGPTYVFFLIICVEAIKFMILWRTVPETLRLDQQTN